MFYAKRKLISIFMSFVLITFSVCQVQALASVQSGVEVEVTQPSVESFAMADCHRDTTNTFAAEPNCHSVCEQLTQHPDVAIKLNAIVYAPLLLTIAEPYALMLAPQSVSAIYPSPDPLAVNPPPTIRYQRLLN